MEVSSLARVSGLVAASSDDPLLDERQASEYLGNISVRTLQRWRAEHRGPGYLFIGRLVRYRKKRHLDRYLEAAERLPVEAL